MSPTSGYELIELLLGETKPPDLSISESFVVALLSEDFPNSYWSDVAMRRLSILKPLINWRLLPKNANRIIETALQHDVAEAPFSACYWTKPQILMSRSRWS